MPIAGTAMAVATLASTMRMAAPASSANRPRSWKRSNSQSAKLVAQSRPKMRRADSAGSTDQSIEAMTKAMGISAGQTRLAARAMAPLRSSTSSPENSPSASPMACTLGEEVAPTGVSSTTMEPEKKNRPNTATSRAARSPRRAGTPG